jgi:hypothetical protein
MGHRDVVAELLKRIENNKYSSGRLDVRDALAVAAQNGDKELADLLLNSQMFNLCLTGSLETIVLAAARGGDEPLLDYFLSKHPDPIVSKCLTKGHPETQDLSLAYRIFVEAVTHGHIGLVRRCLANGVQMYDGGKSTHYDYGLGKALGIAAYHGYTNIVGLIIDHIPDDVESRRDIILPAMVNAAKRGHKSVIEVLVQSGIDLELGTICGRHPLETAALTGQAHVVEYLLSPAVNIQHSAKFTQVAQNALRCAAGKGYESVVKALITAGVPVNDPLTPTEQRSAMLTATMAGRKNIVNLLRQFGAQEFDPSKTRFASDFESGKYPLAEIVANQDADTNGSLPYPGIFLDWILK